MKKITLLVVAIFGIGNAMNASESMGFSEANSRPVNIADAEPVVFTERGIEFFVFADGQFDFNTAPSTGITYYKNGRRNVNATYGAPGVNTNGGVRIEHDAQGRIRRVGNVFVNYDANDRIKRIGSVYMSYNRYALAQVGGLQLVYNRYGQIVDFVGSVKGRTTVYQANNGHQNVPVPQHNNDQYYYKTDTVKDKIEVKIKK